MTSDSWLNVWEGAVRSGKTVCSLVAFLRHIASSPATVFSMSGVSATSCVKNCVDGDTGILRMVPGSKKVGNFTVKLPFSEGSKTIYIYGGGDRGDERSIQGLTSGGHYFDEFSKQTPEFIAMALTRSISYGSDAANFGTMNADDPESPVYSQYIDKYRLMSPGDRQKAGGFSYWFFTLEDNPRLSKRDIERIASQYSGYEYDRYILSRRVRPEGLVYARISALERPAIIDINPDHVDIKFASADWGANHPTVFHIGGDFNNLSEFRPDQYGCRPRAVLYEVVCSRPGQTV